MDKIIVKKLTDQEKKILGVENWPIWEKEPSKFDWEYDQIEQCLILEGEAKVEGAGEVVEFRKGDFVQFPKGLKCRWTIVNKIRKHYNFI